ncbi:MAG: asparaginase [Acidimicrobiia bacterium]|nr:asparaginase [Acidimicrobiia bacterium]
MTHRAPAADSYVPIAETHRSGYAESVHHGAVVALAEDGSVAWSVGDVDGAIYPRSALKPLQAVTMLDLGLDVPDDLLAVVCASHDGRAEHLAAVERLLAAAGLTPGDLENTPELPLDADAADAVIRRGDGPSAITQNCSGKHAAMLATCVINGWATAGYIDAVHPLQQRITADLLARTGRVAHVGVDGCGAPTAAVPLIGLARAVRQLAVDRHRVHAAMTRCPEMVGGPERDVTRLMRLIPGLMAKDGAEGVYVAALPDGRAVALKVADGASRARLPVMIAALRSLGVDVAGDILSEHVMGHGRPVGRVVALVGQP